MTRLPVSGQRALLAEIEPQMRRLLPADLYARVWFSPEPEELMQVFNHLRTLQRALQDYVPRQVAENPPASGNVRYEWRRGTLLFTDLAGFTPLMEANAAAGQKGAIALLGVLNRYFSDMIEIIAKSGGDLLEFTGDALLVQFLEDVQGDDTPQAVRAGLRMQRAMRQYRRIETPQGIFSLAMRVGIHTGTYLAADLGTPRRMVHVLLGQTVQRAKLAESSGTVGRVCVTPEAIARLDDQFELEPCQRPGKEDTHFLIQDGLSTGTLGDYDISLNRRRLSSPLLLDRSPEGLLSEIQTALKRVQLLACYLPSEILNQLIESAAQRRIPPDFPEPTVVFINLMGFPEAADIAQPDEVPALTESFSRAFSLIDAAVKSRGGILQKVTYHAVGSDILVYFGAFSSHREDSLRAASLALAVRDIVQQISPPMAGAVPVSLGLRVGISMGAVFSAEIGEPRGRREFNILGDPVNTAARLMGRAQVGDILLTERVHEAIAPCFECEPLGAHALKGKAKPQMLYNLKGQVERW